MKWIFLVLSILATALAKQKQSIGEMGKHFEGDIMLTNVQRRELFGGTLGKRAGIINTRYRWPNATLVYDFTSDVNMRNQYLAETAMGRISAVTCVKFVRRTIQQDYALISSTGDGCASALGRNGGAQPFILHFGTDYSCWAIGTITHEFLHALGFLHAQSAPNRDSYVKIMWENIQPDMYSQFQIFSNTTVTMFGLPYDYDSVMHYDEKAFSKNGLPTMVPLQAGVTIGNRDKMSQLDIQRINRMYNCPFGQ